MVFRRRVRRSYLRILAESVWPRGGWRRALSYVFHRLRRLPDRPHRIARGIAVGIFMSFTPFFGFHLLFAAAVAWALNANIAAALLATLVGNPLTFPFIMELSVWLGSAMLGRVHVMHLPQIVAAFAHAGAEITHNIEALGQGSDLSWHFLGRFWEAVLLPYLLGGAVPGIVLAAAAYYLSLPLLVAHQRRRLRKLRKRVERRHRDGAEDDTAASGPVRGGAEDPAQDGRI